VLHVILCEFAAMHRDGTFTVVRGGIDFIDLPSIPLDLSLWLLLEAPPKVFSTGGVEVEVTATMPDGLVIAKVQGFSVVTLADPSLPARFAMPVSFKAVSFGTCTIAIRIGTETGSARLDVRELNARASVAPTGAA
jgi:hypothetical protein